MEGLILNLPERVYGDDNRLPPTTVDIADIVGRLTKVSHDILVYHWPSERWNEYYTIKIKDLWSLEKKVIRALPGYLSEYVQRENYVREVTLCEHPECFQQTADQDIAAIKGTLLYDKYGEEPHRIHNCCRRHCGPIAVNLAKSLEVQNVTPGQEFWTKVASWQIKKRWYAQKTELDLDGDHETGYQKYIMGSPFYGPSATREEAINLASSHQF